MNQPDMNIQSMLGLMLGTDMADAVAKMELNEATSGGRRAWFPRDLRSNERKKLLAMGFVFPEETAEDKRDSLVFPVDMPMGWRFGKREGFWAEVLDEAGNHRLSLGYSGQIWDRWCVLHLRNRYIAGHEYSTREGLLGGTPPEIKALEEIYFVDVVVEEERVIHVHRYSFRDDEYEDHPVVIPAKTQREQRTRIAFEPRDNEEHKKLPYRREYVHDNALNRRVFTGSWRTFEEVVAEPSDEKESKAWLKENFPRFEDELAYWYDR